MIPTHSLPAPVSQLCPPGAWLPSPNEPDELSFSESWDTAVSWWKLPLISGRQGSRVNAAMLITSAKKLMENQEWNKHPLCFCRASLLHHEQPRECVVGTERSLLSRAHLFQASSLEVSTLLYPFPWSELLMAFLVSPRLPVYLSTSVMLPRLCGASWPIAAEKCGHHMLAAIESWAHFFSAQPLSCGNHFKGNRSPYNMLVI